MTLEEVKKLFQSDEMQELCRQYGVARLSVFGSTARNEATEQSDLDLLVSFLESKRIGLWEFIALEDKLTQAAKHKVDLVSESALSPHRSEGVLRDKQLIYGA
jgi:predicted nucleotidyltransferase